MIAPWLLAALAHAGAWTRAPGHGYGKVGVDRYQTGALLSPGTGVPPGGTYTAEQLGAWLELGLPAGGWRAHLGVGAAVVSGHHLAEIPSALGPQRVRASSTRPGDLRLAPQIALHPRWPVAVALEAKLPLARNDRVGGSSAWAELFPRPGDGQVDLTPVVWAGGGRGRVFGELGVGWRHRTRWSLGTPGPDFRDGVYASGKAGIDLGRVLPVLGAEAVVSPRPDGVTREGVVLSVVALCDAIDGRLALEPRIAVEPWSRNASRGVAVGLGASLRR